MEISNYHCPTLTPCAQKCYKDLKIRNTQEDEELFNDDEFIKVTRIINEVPGKRKIIRTAKLELLTLTASMKDGNKASVVEGVSNL